MPSGPTVIGTTLVALAILNVGVLQVAGAGLVERVHAKHDELGSSWIALRLDPHSLHAKNITAALVAEELGRVEGTRGARSHHVYSQPWGEPEGSGGVRRFKMLQFLFLGAGYDLDRDGAIFHLFGDDAQETRFLQNPVRLAQGRFPQAEDEVAVEVRFAVEEGLEVGSRWRVPFKTLHFGPNGTIPGFDHNVTIVGMYERITHGSPIEEPRIVLLGDMPHLRERLRSDIGSFALQPGVLVRTTLTGLGPTVREIAATVEALGLTVRTQGQLDQLLRGGTTGGVTAVRIEDGGTLGAPPTMPDVVLLANDDLLANALAAARRSGAWYLTLTTGGILLAALGIGFVTAASDRALRRDIGLRQALGFAARRLNATWSWRAVVHGAAGALLGILLLEASIRVGAARWLLGLELDPIHDLPRLALIVAGSVVLYAAATYPAYRRVLRAEPADNLRLLKE